ncbi:hypothetical protein GDO81_021339 [Engystomops pustulosus]|uniref:Uncharacterized protein n=1 Tax=Engystomops pustulosus TaxID=76066 RepID=A0AAV6YYT3_ENGPU|nr:hypothetical protein GDO81_021339 [Engystomops pustulosus]
MPSKVIKKTYVLHNDTAAKYSMSRKKQAINQLPSQKSKNVMPLGRRQCKNDRFFPTLRFYLTNLVKCKKIYSSLVSP